jgi:glutaredoxin
LAVVILLVPAGGVDADMHRYTDDSGRTHIVDSLEKIPEKYRKRVKSTQTPASPARARPAIAPRVEIFVTSWCGYCRKLESFLKSKKIRYSRYDIEKSSSARKRYEGLGGMGVPVVKIGSDVIRGYSPEAILRALKKKR